MKNENENEDVHLKSAKYELIGFIIILVMIMLYCLFK